MDGNQLMWEARWAAAGYLINIAKHGYTSREYNELYLHFKPAQTAVLVDVDVLKPDTTYYKNRTLHTYYVLSCDQDEQSKTPFTSLKPTWGAYTCWLITAEEFVVTKKETYVCTVCEIAQCDGT